MDAKNLVYASTICISFKCINTLLQNYKYNLLLNVDEVCEIYVCPWFTDHVRTT